MTRMIEMPLFLGEVTLGMKNKTTISAVFDTGSDWLVVPDSSCFDCVGKTHNSSISGQQTSTNASEFSYGFATMTGQTYIDTVCLANSKVCADDFEYFGYSSQVGLNKEIEGILGLSQNKPMMLASEDVAVGPLLVEELKASG